MPDYRLLPETLAENITHFDPNEIFENLHTALHDEGNDQVEVVEQFKYEQELDKSLLSLSSVVGLGFGLMSPVLGMCTSMSIGLKNGGPLTIIMGFLLSGISIWFCSLSLGEVVSKFPMELHGSSALLAPDSLKLICSWYTGWLMLIGNWTMSTSITYAGAQLTISLILMNNSDLISEANLIFFTVIVFYMVVTIVGLVNLKFSRFIEIINKICVLWIIYAIIFIDILLLIFHSGKFRSLKYALFHFDNHLSGYGSGVLSFIIGFQQSNFTLQGFSMLPALSEEVKRPENDIPRGMSNAVLLSTLSGVIFLIPILIILPDIDTLFTGHKILPIVNIFTKSTNSTVVSIFLVLMILGNLFFSGIGSITTSSRSVYSFSRDRGIPYHNLWTYVDPSSVSKVPKYSIWLSMAISYFLGLLALFSTAAFNAFIGAAVLCLCSATVIPLILVLFSRRRVIRNAPVKMKYKLGWIVNIISVLWLLLSMVSVCFPPQIPVTFQTMNYALIVYIFCLISITVLYFKWGKYNFQLPSVDEMNKPRKLKNESINTTTAVNGNNVSGYVPLQDLDSDSNTERLEPATSNPFDDDSATAIDKDRDTINSEQNSRELDLELATTEPNPFEEDERNK
ncbi:hypothetical protein Kpol_2002p70 [Vanderwaltozyma polyspora DSM 70294]|uniref:Amino acid permease/ SLC12A domain-containing protein n=1 Tax=Vanderwaltozyma polyspora (strain ATCC 22028 / DSM 70294 / BCRC 21397 / CBS 2163 / NBRC 10782 / NRRL Y-8283 / UCD 57-17) TaxID=436907 RepID=A7TFI5_VANPO|nr:uncharacterized protein Kpol_2002p70 [Vanderwaltozyma polyspora DSM 70294]EDO18999.1 hypothetical protein Kpol_2002p70 [Vanderwaltozyma polyspora DSM 70294]